MDKAATAGVPAQDRHDMQGRHMRANAIFPLAIMLAAGLAGAQAQTGGPRSLNWPLDWQTFSVPEFGTRVEYPAGIFTVTEGLADKGLGERLRSADGRALLTIYSRANEAGETPASYLRSNLRVERSALDYERVTRSFFAISATRDTMVLYSRCNFSGGAVGAIHCFDLIYPQEQSRAWDEVVTRISRSLRPLDG
jgi:hypothetical protein